MHLLCQAQWPVRTPVWFLSRARSWQRQLSRCIYYIKLSGLLGLKLISGAGLQTEQDKSMPSGSVIRASASSSEKLSSILTSVDQSVSLVFYSVLGLEMCGEGPSVG